MMDCVDVSPETEPVFVAAGQRAVGDALDEEAIDRLLGTGVSIVARRVGRVPPGKYTVHASAPDGTPGKRTVNLRGQPERRAQVRLEP